MKSFDPILERKFEEIRQNAASDCEAEDQIFHLFMTYDQTKPKRSVEDEVT